ncbi:hypothetical protein Lal_00001827 [Lupinus albus]|nr:hypothetical protein Lal_00001827 [Lupinus albus]
MTRPPPGSSTVQAPFPTYAMLPRHRPTTLRACGVFAGRSLPVVPSSPLAVWAVRPPPCRGTKQGIASGIGADSASAASCRTGVIQYVVPHVPPLLRSFPILIVKHHEQQDVEVRNSK